MNFKDITNEDLYYMCVRGEESAWDYVQRYVLTIAKSPKWQLRESPEDTAQGIVCHLLTKGLEKVNQPKAFRGFIARVAVNFILDKLKGTRVFFESIDAAAADDDRPPLDIEADNPGPEELVLGDGLVLTLKRAIESLSSRCHEVLTAYVDYKNGLYDSYRELAAACGRSIGTLSSQIKRCLDELRQDADIKAWLEK